MDRLLKVLDFSTHASESHAGTASAPSSNTAKAVPIADGVDSVPSEKDGTTSVTRRACSPPRHHTATKEDAHHAKAVRLLWCDSGGIRRCRVVQAKRYADVQSSGLGITAACMAMPAHSDSPAAGAGLTAVGEAGMKPVESTRVTLPWYPDHQMALVEFERPRGVAPWDCCPRRALRNTCKMLHDNFGLSLKVGFELEFLLLERAPPGEPGLGGSGYRPVEVSLYCQSSAMDRQAKVLDGMVEAMEAMGIAVVQWHPESAPGQYEIALMYGDPVDAADKLLLAKEAIVGVAGCHGLAVSFLPRPFPDAAGNGLHVHLSLWKDGKCHMHIPRTGGVQSDAAAGLVAAACDLSRHHHHTHHHTHPPNKLQNHHSTPPADPHSPAHAEAAAPRLSPYKSLPQYPLHQLHGRGRRSEEGSAAAAAAGHRRSGGAAVEAVGETVGEAALGTLAGAAFFSPSDEMLAFLAGLLEYLDVLLPFTAPSPNSYERLRPGAWAGSHAAWGYNNKEVPLRVTAPGPNFMDKMHIEYKAMDGTANPYLALSGIMVAGMLGVFSQLVPPEPCQVPPCDLEPETAARLGVRLLPASLNQALELLQTSRTGETFRSAMVEAISGPLVQAYLAVRAAEAEQAPHDPASSRLLRYS